MKSAQSIAIDGLHVIEDVFLNKHELHEDDGIGSLLVTAAYVFSRLDTYKLKVLLDINNITFFNDTSFTSRLLECAIVHLAALGYSRNSIAVRKVKKFMHEAGWYD